MRGVIHRVHVGLAGTPPPQHGPLELQRLANLTKRLSDRIVDGRSIDCAETGGDIGDEPLEAQVRVGRRGEACFEIEPFGDVDDRQDRVARRALGKHAETDFDRHRHAVLAHAADGPAGDHRGAVRLIPEARPSSIIRGRHVSRQQARERRAD